MTKKLSSDASARRTQTPVKCDHAWVLNVKPAVCLWCGARRPERKRA